MVFPKLFTFILVSPDNVWFYPSHVIILTIQDVSVNAGIVMCCHANVTFCDIPCDTAFDLGIMNVMCRQKIRSVVPIEWLPPDTGRKQNLKYRGVTGKWTEKWRMVYGKKNKMVHSRYQPNERTWRLFLERRQMQEYRK